jgi:hypothetical protein
MSTVRRYFVRGVIALPVGAVAMLWSGNVPLRDPTAGVSTATARLGAPATPLSVGGVARRTTRGGVVAGAPGGGAAGAAAARPGLGIGGVGGAGAPGGGAGANRAGVGR